MYFSILILCSIMSTYIKQELLLKRELKRVNKHRGTLVVEYKKFDVT